MLVGRLHHGHAEHGAGIDGLDAEIRCTLAEVGLKLHEKGGGEGDALGRTRPMALLGVDDFDALGDGAVHPCIVPKPVYTPSLSC